MSDIVGIHRQLRLAVNNLNSRGLQLASKWACEQLVGMEIEDSGEVEQNRSSDDGFSLVERVSERENDLLLLARSLLTNGEYQRCAHLLRRSTNFAARTNLLDRTGIDTSAKGTSKLLANEAVKSKLGIFLSVYSMYMAGEKLKEQLQATDNSNNSAIFPGMIGASNSIGDKQSSADGSNNDAKSSKAIHSNAQSMDGQNKKNPFLNELFEELEPLYRDHQMDGFILYIFAVVVRDLVKQGQIQGQGGSKGLFLFPPNNKLDAHSQLEVEAEGDQPLSAYNLFAEAIQLYPWNWCV